MQLSVQRLGCPLRDLAVATDRGADSADGHAGMVRELLSGELDPCRLCSLGDLLEYYRPLHKVSQLRLDISSQVPIDNSSRDTGQRPLKDAFPQVRAQRVVRRYW